MKEIKVYIASPYTNGWMPSNIKLQLKAADELMNLGYFPYVPLLAHFQEIYNPRTENDWLNLDFVWLKQCDVVLRLQNFDRDGNVVPSSGADKEEALAKASGIPIFYSIDELNDWAKANAKQLIWEDGTGAMMKAS
jgi:hypothetical protein